MKCNLSDWSLNSNSVDSNIASKHPPSRGVLAVDDELVVQELWGEGVGGFLVEPLKATERDESEIDRVVFDSRWRDCLYEQVALLQLHRATL